MSFLFWFIILCFLVCAGVFKVGEWFSFIADKLYYDYIRPAYIKRQITKLLLFVAQELDRCDDREDTGEYFRYLLNEMEQYIWNDDNTIIIGYLSPYCPGPAYGLHFVEGIVVKERARTEDDLVKHWHYKDRFMLQTPKKTILECVIKKTEDLTYSRTNNYAKPYRKIKKTNV
jgi:hypothetical protein